ncbi:hypothetical protein BHE90_009844 [Fusarium euwallaceae]|uniref:Heterokaryon incompatibility domain-containing protein n=1 Tax=Fusarium euwallaceae TaxID=1147111 RepID=A0A430LJ74_9HYPO|nr:hypothetical protein BHE90_009844 [Fusarium euwallaceae]
MDSIFDYIMGISEPTDDEPPPLCNVCHDFKPIQSRKNASEDYPMLKFRNIKEEQLREDCHRCRLLKATLERVETQLFADFEGFEVQNKDIFLTPQSDDVVLARYMWRRKKTDPNTDVRNSYFSREINIRRAGKSEVPETTPMGVLTSLHRSPKSDESLQFLKNMLETCDSGEGLHSRCLHGQAPLLPTRVLKIGPEDGPLQLYESQPGETGKYTALSHCWGPRAYQPLRTTRQSLSMGSSSVSLNNHSAVFNDAIWLCRQLGIDYIWIDSLCIVQDDAQDWEIESAKMAQYYSLAHLTIAAETSSNGTVPFLRERDERWQAMAFKTTDQDGSPFTYVAQEHYRSESYTEGPKNYYPNGCDLLPSRAWTVQESMLSNRIIHFTPSDMVWECYNGTASQDVYRNASEAMHFNVREVFYALDYLEATDEERVEGAYQVWSGILQQFSRRSITFESDRLPAFSGVATRFSKYFPGRYLAGIWEEHLFPGLYWHRATPFSNNPDHFALEETFAPSWSWASLPSKIPIIYPHELSKYSELEPLYRPTVLEAFCDVSEKAPFGQVRNGYILMEAPLSEVTITCTANQADIKYHISFGAEVQHRGSLGPAITVDTFLAMDGITAARATSEGQMAYRHEPSTFQATAWVLWLGGSTKTQMFGIVLRRDGESEEYSRLGSVWSGTIKNEDTFPIHPIRRRMRLV